ncbi:MAG: histidine kinase dimerization/phosphoacceptor domain -containing protein [Ignavibacteriales bacterium]
MMKKINSILIKIALIVTFSVILCMGIFGRYTYLVEKKRLMNDVRSTQELRLNRISNNLVSALWTYNEINSREIISFDMQNQDMIAIIVRKESKELFTGFIRNSGSSYEDYEPGKQYPVLKNTYVVRKEKAIMRGESVIGYLEIYFSERIIYDELHKITVRVITETLLISLIIIITIYFSLKKIIGNPLKKLSTSMEEVSNGNYQIKLESKSKDEIASLIRSFNNMIEQLEKQRTALKDNEIKYWSLFDEANDAIFLIKDGTFFECNKRASEVFDLPKDKIIGLLPAELFPEPEEGSEPGNGKKDRLELAINEGPQYFERQYKNADGSSFYIDINLYKVELQGEIILQAMVRDITSRKNDQEKILASLKEKEVLLKEIHHRVKNNLQVISSLLNLQAGYIQDESALEMFKNSQNRVRSMALIHEKLYQSDNLAQINFTEYVKNLVSNLFRSYQVRTREISLRIDMPEELFLGVDTAIPCGLIINELVTNALKYGFHEKLKGEVCISFNIEDEAYRLKVSNNGDRFPSETVDLCNPKTLGLQLVNILASQLRGNFELITGSLIEFIIIFPVRRI